jgi:uncharacterized BrkB/YihY/UPF0761 family membrane protein
MKRSTGWTLLGVVATAAVTVVLVPVFVIMPFKSQSESGLALSYALRHWAPVVTTIALVTGWVLGAWLAVTGVAWRRLLPAVPVAMVTASAWFARQNHFEWMFAPLPNAGYVRAAEAGFVKPGDMVLGVVVNGEAVAYPVNQVAYHHVVNDVVGGVPIVATY